MGTTRRSLVPMAFTRSRRAGVREKMCALGVRFGGSVGRVDVVFCYIVRILGRVSEVYDCRDVGRNSMWW